MASSNRKVDGAGSAIVLSPVVFCYWARSTSLSEGGANRGKNTNVFQPVGARSFAAQVVQFGPQKSTNVVLMPEKGEWATKALFLEGLEKALESIPATHVSRIV